MYSYSAYGLDITSQIELPGFLAQRSVEPEGSDVSIRFATIEPSDLDRLLGEAQTHVAPGCDVRVSENAMYFDYSSGVRILVFDGSQVLIELTGDATEADITPYLTGYVIAVLLLQRGYLVLHASVVMIEGQAIAFLGDKGYGKSTLAASFNVRGNPLISDDHLPIVVRDGKVFTIPGYPQIRLFADSIAAVGATTNSLAPVHPLTAKYMLPSETSFSTAEVPLSAIYVLSLDDDIGIDRLPLSDAFIQALRHTHINYYLKDANGREDHFASCHALVRSVPFFLLRRPHDFEKMNLVTDIVGQHSLRIRDGN